MVSAMSLDLMFAVCRSRPHRGGHAERWRRKWDILIDDELLEVLISRLSRSLSA